MKHFVGTANRRTLILVKHLCSLIYPTYSHVSAFHITAHEVRVLVGRRVRSERCVVAVAVNFGPRTPSYFGSGA